MKPDMQRQLWNHLESEIFLHRHKTVIRACQGSNSQVNELGIDRVVCLVYDLVQGDEVI